MRVPLLFLLATIALSTVALAPCGETEEVAPDTVPTVTLTSTTAPPTAIATSPPSPAPIPEDWLTYTDPGGLFTLRYPPTWFAEDYSVYSYDPKTWQEFRPPPEAVEVEFGYYEAKGSSGCGALSVDPATGEGIPRAGAMRATLGGVEAWESIGEAGDGTFEGNFTRIHGVAAIHNGYCLYIAAYFTQLKPDSVAFLQIVSSYRFLDVKP